MDVRILDPRIRDWGIPAYQTPGSAAVDLFACIGAALDIAPQAPAVLISAGIALSFDDFSCAGLILPRSGQGHKRGLVLGNSTGLIDPDYTGEILISTWNRNPAGSPPITVQPGERIAQMIFVPVLRPSFTVVEAFSGGTARAAGGFGSTGA
ncbi:dUTP diphosphatase [Paracoccus sediminis]|uniref:dUTP diphosphatase n=1 Tax=Paracoccus sediminis TaxID=1214787 RepID=A0A238XPS2_9RHOB|nr:dUTP diphosphatase [Paracoccus sediminis]TBN48224.1 dUTP diphosphatase [Paracoccus sediminis]SNR61026.1 deoxyuridine 5'-triphosphate nucleotidohydrolase [Paracoccus sediminis]